MITTDNLDNVKDLVSKGYRVRFVQHEAVHPSGTYTTDGGTKFAAKRNHKTIPVRWTLERKP